ncbi:MAG: DUF2807 domain-containing protein [Methylibium sp.]|nr:DUF2807 domain-containing protein [Methylibium sp.]
MHTRRFALMTVAVAGLGLAGGAQAWTWSFGKGERVQGSGDVATETRSPGSFDGIALSGNFKLRVRQASTNAVELKADRNLLPYIETELNGSTLEVRAKKGYQLSSERPILLVVDMVVLKKIAIGGSGDVLVEAMKTPQLDVSIGGSGDVSFAQLYSEQATLSVAGSGNVEAKGRVNSLRVSVAGSGNVKTTELIADEVRVSIAGSGDARVQATKQLKVSIAGSGDVRYVGSPEVSSSVAGSGSVRKLGN